MREVYWSGKVKTRDDFGRPIEGQFYDAKSKFGPWAIMGNESFPLEAASPELGLGRGQKYTQQLDGRWLKTGG